MTEYKCDKCDKVFDRPSNLKRHLQRKIPCDLKGNPYLDDLKPGDFWSTKKNNSSENLHICQFCSKTFNNKGNLTRHINKNCQVKKIYNKNNCKEVITKLCCPYCDKDFATKHNMKRHILNRCKIKKRIDEEKEQIYQSLLKDKIGANDSITVNSKGKINNTNAINNSTVNSHNTNNNTINITNNNTIKLVAFGREDLSYIPKKQSIKLLRSGFMSIPNTAEYVHFNPDTPQFHNVYIPNKKEPYAMIYDGKRWKLVDMDHTLSQLYGDSRYYLEEKFKEFYESLDVFAKEKFNRFLDEVDNDEMVQLTKDRLKLLILNNKDIIVGTKKLLEK